MPWARVFSCATDPKYGHVPDNAKIRRKDASRGGKVRHWVTFGACALAALACLQIYIGQGFGRVVGVGNRRRNEIIATRVLEPSARRPTFHHSYLDRSTLDAHALDVFKLGALPWQTGTSFYQGLPVSDLRPSGQFHVHSADLPSSLKPIITIVTATRNPREIFFTRTVRFVLQQSLQAFRWVVVNDCSDDEVSVVRLEELRRWAAAVEPRRILVLDRTETDCAALGGRGGNGPAAMNYGLRLVDSPFVAILDDDDMWELTTLEKAALVMSWVPQAYAVSFDVVNHGAKQFLWKRGFHNGDESFFTENNLMQGSPFRSRVLDKCRFREDMADGGADWDFWMCMASHGMWGLHVPEQGNWYQWNPPEFRKKRWRAVTTHAGLDDLRQSIQQRYSNLLEQDAWPSMVLPPREKAAEGEAGGLQENSRDGNHYRAPFANRVGNQDQRAVLLVLHDLDGGVALTTSSSSGDDGEVLQYAKAFAEAGWRVTVLVTHYTDDDDPGRRQALMRYTHDLFVGANIAPLHRLADLVAYLVETRGVEAVVVVPVDPSQMQISRRLVSASIGMLDRAVAVVDNATGAGETFDANKVRTREAVAGLIARVRPGRLVSSGRPRHTTQTAPSWSAFVQRSLHLKDNTPTGDLPDNLDRRRIDMRQVQAALQYRKRRNGFGRELQIACPERVYANTRWIDALEHPMACDGGTHVLLEVDLLQKSALKQCGAWCLANLGGGKGLVGWEFTGSCFRPLGRSPNDAYKCHAELARRSAS